TQLILHESLRVKPMPKYGRAWVHGPKNRIKPTHGRMNEQSFSIDPYLNSFLVLTYAKVIMDILVYMILSIAGR
ncbi:hypothetical protein SK128_021910, partial [Halocaridina rubra]